MLIKNNNIKTYEENTYFKEDFRYQKEVERNNRVRFNNEDYAFLCRTYNAVLKTFGIDPDLYYIANHQQDECLIFTIYKKSDHKVQFNISFNDRDEFDSNYLIHVYCETEEEAEHIKPFVLAEIEEFFSKVNHFEIKEIEKQRCSTYPVNFNEPYKQYELSEAKEKGMSGRITYEESQKPFKLVTKGNKRYDYASQLKYDFLIMSIVFYRDFDQELTVEDYELIKSLKVKGFDSMDFIDQHNLKETRSLMFFNDHGGLTEESKELLELHFKY